MLLLIARVTRGGRERQREGEQEEKRQRPGMKPPSSRKCATVRVKSLIVAHLKQNQWVLALGFGEIYVTIKRQITQFLLSLRI